MTPTEKLIASRCRLLSVCPYYGYFGMQMRWAESDFSWLKRSRPDAVPTMGVRAINGYIECLWYPEFVQSRTVEQLYGVIQHEIEHVLRLHCVRHYKKENDKLFGMAADLAVNGRQNSPRIGYCDSGKTILPVNDDEQMLWIPNDWPDNETVEYYYERLKQNQDKMSGKALGLKSAEGDSDKIVGGDDCGDDCGDTLDDHSIWSSSDMSIDAVRQVVKNIAEQAASRAQGNIPGHIAELLQKLKTPIVSWRQILRNYMGRFLGNRRWTYLKRNRRHDEFGIPGTSQHAAAKLTVIVDTSGSIQKDDLEQFFTEIEAISYRTATSVLQWDMAFQGFWPRYRRNDWKKLKISGRGGTCMTSAIEWLEKNKAIGQLCIVLTDGYTGWPSRRPFPLLACITTNDGSAPTWGTTIRMNKQSVRLAGK